MHVDPETGETVVTLRRPVVRGKETVRELRVRGQMTAGDMLAMDKAEGALAQKFHLIAEMTGQPVSVIEALLPLDWADVQGVINDLLGKDPGQPGETSSSS